MKLEEYCKNKEYKYILTTADPDNIYSSYNMIKAGYEKKDLKFWNEAQEIFMLE